MTIDEINSLKWEMIDLIQYKLDVLSLEEIKEITERIWCIETANNIKSKRNSFDIKYAYDVIKGLQNEKK